jgi:ABC-type glycerol-3-phosphate transport system substrate-binding protein
MKKTILVLALATTLVACGGAATEATTDSTTVATDTTAVVADTTAVGGGAPVSEDVTGKEQTPVKEDIK